MTGKPATIHGVARFVSRILLARIVNRVEQPRTYKYRFTGSQASGVVHDPAHQRQRTMLLLQ